MLRGFSVNPRNRKRSRNMTTTIVMHMALLPLPVLAVMLVDSIVF